MNADREDMKKKNRGTVLKLIATGRCSSRIELSREMHLTKTAISKIVTELMENGYLIETKKQENADLGRNPIGLGIADTAPLVIGILIMRDFCEAVLCNLKLEILRSEKISRGWKDQEELMETVYSLADQMMLGTDRAGGIGVACIGPLDSIEDNDNQSAALAEKLFGIGRGYQDIFLTGLSSGVGCGIIIGNEKYQSSSGYTPEIGHLSIDYQGEKCVCGNRGCLELYLNSRTVLKRMREATGKFYDYKTFCEQWENLEIGGIFEDLVEKLSSALVSVVNILNPDLIILGHDGVWWPQRYVQQLEELVNERKFSNHQTRTQIVKASYLDKTAVLGGACNAIQQYFQGELL